MNVVTFIALLVFFVIFWYLVIKAKIKYDRKKPLVNLAEKIEKQEQRFLFSGKEVNLKEQLGLAKQQQVEKLTKVEKEVNARAERISELENIKRKMLDTKEQKKPEKIKPKVLKEETKQEEEKIAITNKETGTIYIIQNGKIIDTIQGGQK